MKTQTCGVRNNGVRGFSGAAVKVLASALICIGVSHAQKPVPPETPPVPDMSALDSSKAGYDGLAIDLKAAGIAFEPLDYDIDRWQKFLEQARQEINALKNSTKPADQAEVARLTQAIPTAESHIAALEATKKLRQDAEHCGLEDVYADWQDLLKQVEQERQNIEPAAEMAQKIQAMGPLTHLGDAGTAFSGLSATLMQRALENDEELSRVAQDNLGNIEQACIEAKQHKNYETYMRNLKAANPIAERAASQAEMIAASGKLDDTQVISDLLVTVIEVARANQLTGNEKEGIAQWQEAVHVTKTFLTNVAANCAGQSTPLPKLFTLERTRQMLGVDVDLSPCMNHLYEASGIAGMPYRLRHCGIDPTGTWHLQVTHAQGDGKPEGETVVQELGPASPMESPLPSLTATHRETAPAQIEAAGRMTFASYKPTTVHVKGTIQISVETYIRRNGVLLHNDMKMHTEMKLEGMSLTVIPQGGGQRGYSQGAAEPAFDAPITIGYGNKPCNPNADIWSYPASQ